MCSFSVVTVFVRLNDGYTKTRALLRTTAYKHTHTHYLSTQNPDNSILVRSLHSYLLAISLLIQVLFIHVLWQQIFWRNNNILSFRICARKAKRAHHSICGHHFYSAGKYGEYIQSAATPGYSLSFCCCYCSAMKIIIQ